MEGGAVVGGRATIDTRPPFGSVKEAVTLFGEKVLAGEVYRPKLLQKMESRSSSGGGGNLKSELEETKLRLEQSLEEEKMLATTLESVREELEQTRRELQHLKSKNCSYYEVEPITNPEIEVIKFVERPALMKEYQTTSLKKFVSFASPPSLVKELGRHHQEGDVSFRQREAKSNKKALGWGFSWKKGNTY